MLFSQSRLWLLCLVRLRTTCNSHCTDREKAIWLRATNNRSDANCQSVMFLLTIVQLLCVPTGANCTMPLNFFPHLLYQTMGTLVCAVWGTGSLWCVVTESLLCWPIEPGSTSVLLIEETSGQQLCSDKMRPSVGLGCWTNAEKVTYSITQRLWLLGNFLTLDVKRKKNDFIECMEQKGAEW